MSMPPITATLSVNVQRLLMDMVKPKFDAYFLVTSSASGTRPRSVQAPHGQPWFIYPIETMIPDLAFLWSLFADVYQTLGGPGPLAAFVRQDANLRSHFHRIIEGHSAQDPDGEFWHFPGGLVPLQQAADKNLEDVLRTLRNGFAHSHWLFADLSARDYWNALDWETGGAPAAFNLQGRPRKNYMMYIADGRGFNPHAFWGVKDLRILVTPAHILRYHLHLFLNFVLNGSKDDVFQA
jgi:hypothetical protein